MPNNHIEKRQEDAPERARLDHDTAITPFPWTVESHPDTEGGFIIHEARHEQQIWCDQGYDLSEEEGNRRSLVVARHNVGNIRMIQAAPELFAALRDMVSSPLKARDSAVRVLEGISPYWWDLKITRNPNEFSS